MKKDRIETKTTIVGTDIFCDFCGLPTGSAVADAFQRDLDSKQYRKIGETEFRLYAVMYSRADWSRRRDAKGDAFLQQRNNLINSAKSYDICFDCFTNKIAPYLDGIKITK